MSLIRFCLAVAMLATMPAAALAAPPPSFATPDALVAGIYAEIEASNDWETYDYDKGFDPHDTFSAALQAKVVAADAIVNPTGEFIGALDFSPFINGQDSGGLTFDIAPARTKRDRASALVTVMLDGKALYDIRLDMVEESDGWKVDDFLLPGDDGPWRLSDYLADPLNF